MKTLISIDPGLSTGLIVGTYSDTEPFRVTHAFQIEGGVEGFLKNVRLYTGDYGENATLSLQMPLPTGVYPYIDLWGEVEDEDGDYVVEHSATVLVEKFNARGSANAGFSYTTDSLEALRVEGALIAQKYPINWVQPAQQYFMGGESKAEKLKSRNAWFKEHAELGYYLTGKSVGQKDADDARSALAHCISWLRREKHLPTLELFRKEDK